MSTLTTGNVILDMELPLLTEDELGKLADYAKYLRWSREDENDDWADAPLTPEEEAQIEEGRKAFARGEYLTLDEFRKSQDDWADAPLTPEEEAQIKESDMDYENGEYLTVDELLAGLQECGQ